MSRSPDPPPTFVTLREMVEAMASYRDDEVFRWYQESHVGPGGWVVPDRTLGVTMGQVRAELAALQRAPSASER